MDPLWRTEDCRSPQPSKPTITRHRPTAINALHSAEEHKSKYKMIAFVLRDWGRGRLGGGLKINDLSINLQVQGLVQHLQWLR